MSLTNSDLQAIRQAVREETKPEIEKIESMFSKIDTKFSEIASKFELLDSKLYKIDTNFNEIDSRLDQVDSRFEKIDSDFKKIGLRFDLLERKLSKKIISAINSLRDELTETIIDASESVLAGVQLMFDERDKRIEIIESDVTKLKKRINTFT